MLLATRPHRHWLLVIVVALAGGCGPGGNPGENHAGVDAGCDGAPCVDPCTADPHGPGCAYRAIAGAFHVFGVTSDNYALIADGNGTTSMLDLAHGTLTQIATDYTQGFISGNVAFVFHGGALGSTHLPLVIWTAANGARELDPSGMAFNNPPSSDGTHVLWIGNVTSDGASGDVLLGAVDGATPPRTLLAGVDLTGSCALPLGANITESRAIFASCQSGQSATTLASYDVDSGALLGSTASQVIFTQVDGHNGHILFPTATGASVSDLDITHVTPIATDYQNGSLTHDGKSVLYTDTEGRLQLVSVDGGTPVLVQPGPALFIQAIAPDSSVALYSTMQDGTTANADLYLTALVPNAPPPLQLRATTDVQILGDAFTTDSQFALYAANVDTAYNGALWAQPTTGGAGRMLTKLDFYWRTLAGSRIVYSDVPVETTTPNGLADGVVDLDLVDLASGAPPTTLVKSVNAYFFADDTTLVYAVYDDPTRAGVYTMTLP